MNWRPVQIIFSLYKQLKVEASPQIDGPNRSSTLWQLFTFSIKTFNSIIIISKGMNKKTFNFEPTALVFCIKYQIFIRLNNHSGNWPRNQSYI